MEHSEIILIALVLAIVFAGAQVEKVITLFRTSDKKPVDLPAVKTVLSAQEKMPVRKKVASKATTKKTGVKATSKVSSTKRTTTAAKKKTTAKK